PAWMLALSRRSGAVAVAGVSGMRRFFPPAAGTARRCVAEPKGALPGASRRSRSASRQRCQLAGDQLVDHLHQLLHGGTLASHGLVLGVYDQGSRAFVGAARKGLLDPVDIGVDGEGVHGRLELRAVVALLGIDV